ncbi:mannitol-1-phosphate 5-dehydrogenase [Clostridium sp. DL1XJH146]
MKAINFGAGNIGRGFIGYLINKSGYKVFFVDVNEAVVNSINEHKEYSVITVGDEIERETIKDVSAIDMKDMELLRETVLDADLITTAVGVNNLKYVAKALKDALRYKMDKNNSKLDIIACENLLFATNILKEALLEGEDKEFIDYVEETVGFPNCTVDRIVPNIEIEKELDIDVAVEKFFEWDIEKDKVKVNSNINGASYVNNIEFYMERKLFLLNGAHAATAYLGYKKSYKYIHEAIKDSELKSTVLCYHAEAIHALKNKYGKEAENLNEYSKRIIKRFENKYLKDEVTRVGRDPVRKLGYNDRLITLLKLCDKYNLESSCITTILAAGYSFEYEKDEKAKEIQSYIDKFGIKEAVLKFSGLEDKEYLADDIVRKI